MLTLVDLPRLVFARGERFPRRTPGWFGSSGEPDPESDHSFQGTDSASASSPRLVPSESRRHRRLLQTYGFQAIGVSARASEYRLRYQYEPARGSCLSTRLAVRRLFATARCQPQNHPASLHARSQERRGDPALQMYLYYRARLTINLQFHANLEAFLDEHRLKARGQFMIRFRGPAIGGSEWPGNWPESVMTSRVDVRAYLQRVTRRSSTFSRLRSRTQTTVARSSRNPPPRQASLHGRL